MVFRLSHDASKDGEDSNNNEQLGLPARRPARRPSSSTTASQGGEEGGVEARCCCGPSWFHRRHSAKVSPEIRQGFDLNDLYTTVLDVQPPQHLVQLYDAPLTLDSIDSTR